MELRPAFDALFDLEQALADVVMTSTQPALGAIRLAWWREALERLDRSPPPAEPRLQAIAAELLPRGLSGEQLAAIEDGFAALLEAPADVARVGGGGTALFRCAGCLLGSTDEALGQAGAIHSIGRALRLGMIALPPGFSPHLPARRIERNARPLTGFARLAIRDIRRFPQIEPEATPARAASLLSHRLFGTIA